MKFVYRYIWIHRIHPHAIISIHFSWMSCHFTVSRHLTMSPDSPKSSTEVFGIRASKRWDHPHVLSVCLLLLLLLVLVLLLLLMMRMMMQCFIITIINHHCHPQGTTPCGTAVEDTRAICLWKVKVDPDWFPKRDSQRICNLEGRGDWYNTNASIHLPEVFLKPPSKSESKTPRLRNLRPKFFPPVQHNNTCHIPRRNSSDLVNSVYDPRWRGLFLLRDVSDSAEIFRTREI